MCASSEFSAHTYNCRSELSLPQNKPHLSFRPQHHPPTHLRLLRLAFTPLAVAFTPGDGLGGVPA